MRRKESAEQTALWDNGNIYSFMNSIQYVLSKAGVMEESVNRELNITRS